MKNWVLYISLVVVAFTGCQKAPVTAEEGRLAEAQIEKLSAEREKARAVLSQLESSIASNGKQLAEIQKVYQEHSKKMAEFHEVAQAAEKNIVILKTLSDKTDAAFEAVRNSAAITQRQIRGLQNGLIKLKFSTLQEEPAILSTSNKEYNLARTDMGSFPISVEKAEPYLDGHKIILNVGNPLSTGLTGGKLHVKYGSRPPVFPKTSDGEFDFGEEVQAKYNQEKEAWEKALKEKEVSVLGVLGAGAWTDVEMILTPTKPEEVAYLEVKLSTTGVKMGGYKN